MQPLPQGLRNIIVPTGLQSRYFLRCTVQQSLMGRPTTLKMHLLVSGLSFMDMFYPNWYLSISQNSPRTLSLESSSEVSSDSSFLLNGLPLGKWDASTSATFQQFLPLLFGNLSQKDTPSLLAYRQNFGNGYFGSSVQCFFPLLQRELLSFIVLLLLKCCGCCRKPRRPCPGSRGQGLTRARWKHNHRIFRFNVIGNIVSFTV